MTAQTLDTGTQDLLASLDASGDESIQMHAEATDAIAVLEEHVPRSVVDMAADGRVRSHIGRTAPLSELGSVFDDLEAGRYVGRAVLTDLTR